jgi:putative nucleotidyltransferase with HDIG domain
MGIVSYGLVFSYNTAGILGTLVILVPLLLLRLGQKQYIDRTSAVVNELRQKNVTLEKTSQEINRLNNGLLETLAEVVDLRDPYVLGHSRQVTHYAVLIAEKLGLQPGQIELIRKAGLLHDIGKLGVPESILLKPKKLTSEEYKISRKHVSLGADILRNSPPLQPLIPIVLHHHERYDGTGYPEGLHGEDIPIEARIIGVADAVEAMASDRPYRRALTPQEILGELKKNTGTQFDPVVVNAFLKILDEKGLSLVVNSAYGELKTKKSRSLHPKLGILDVINQTNTSNNGSRGVDRGSGGSMGKLLEPNYAEAAAKKTAPLKR